MKNAKSILILGLSLLIAITTIAQTSKGGKKISSDLFGLFFEDINYSADGGLYAELVQNRSFEYNPTEQKDWNPFSYWEYISPGFSYGRVSVETSAPIHPNNTHYLVLDVEHVGNEVKFVGNSGVGLKNSGFDGMVVKSSDRYNFSMFVSQLSKEPILFSISLQNPKGEVLAECKINTSSNDWTKYTASLIPTRSCDTASLVILATTEGKFAIDVVSLFPEKTFKNRSNG